MTLKNKIGCKVTGKFSNTELGKLIRYGWVVVE